MADTSPMDKIKAAFQSNGLVIRTLDLALISLPLDLLLIELFFNQLAALEVPAIIGKIAIALLILGSTFALFDPIGRIREQIEVLNKKYSATQVRRMGAVFSIIGLIPLIVITSRMLGNFWPILLMILGPQLLKLWQPQGDNTPSADHGQHLTSLLNSQAAQTLLVLLILRISTALGSTLWLEESIGRAYLSQTALILAVALVIWELREKLLEKAVRSKPNAHDRRR